ncbi:hypothetical protein JCM8097_006790 [Rhodosporidiobolus ruineniae]
MSQTTSGSCCVCGKETTTRCQACGKAGISLFFCSSEHQKLVWFAHKQVCGPGKANPFVWPDLSQTEANEACKYLHTWSRSGPHAMAPLATFLNQRFPAFTSKGALAPQIQALTRQKKHHFSGSYSLRQNLLRDIRSYEAARMSVTNTEPAEVVDRVLRRTSNFCANSNKVLELASAPSPPSWVVPLHHQVVCFFALKQLAQQDESLSALSVQTRDELEKLISTVMATESPAAAAELKDIVEPILYPKLDARPGVFMRPATV